MSAKRTFAAARLSRALSAAVGIGFAAAAAVTAAQTFSGLAETRSARWPIYAADAATFALFAFLAIIGALMHPTALAAGSALLMAYFFGNYESESVVIPGIGAAAVMLLVTHVRSGSLIVELGRRRQVVLALSFVAGLASIIAMQAEVGVVSWQRVRTASGGVESRVLRSTGTCEVYRDAPQDIDEIDSGCEPRIPARRAHYVIGYNALAAALTAVALTGARRTADEPA